MGRKAGFSGARREPRGRTRSGSDIATGGRAVPHGTRRGGPSAAGSPVPRSPVFTRSRRLRRRASAGVGGAGRRALGSPNGAGRWTEDVFPDRRSAEAVGDKPHSPAPDGRG